MPKSKQQKQGDLFARYCPPGSDPLEAWVDRLVRNIDRTSTQKALGLVLAHHVSNVV